MFDFSDQLLNSPLVYIFPFYRLMINYSLHVFTYIPSVFKKDWANTGSTGRALSGVVILLAFPWVSVFLSHPWTDLRVSCFCVATHSSQSLSGPMAFYTLRNSRSVVATLRPLAFAKAEDQTATHQWLSLPPLVLFPALLFRDQPCEDRGLAHIPVHAFIRYYWCDIGWGRGIFSCSGNAVVVFFKTLALELWSVLYRYNQD